MTKKKTKSPGAIGRPRFEDRNEVKSEMVKLRCTIDQLVRWNKAAKDSPERSLSAWISKHLDRADARELKAKSK